MKPLSVGIAAMLLFVNALVCAQNNTPLEILINEAHYGERFENIDLFRTDDRRGDYLNDFLTKYTLLRLNNSALKEVLSTSADLITFKLPVSGQAEHSLKLVKYDILAEGFQIIERNGNEDSVIPTPNGAFFRGISERGSDAQAAFSLFENEIFGLFSNLEQGNIILTKDPINPGDAGENYILYFESDLKEQSDLKCASGDLLDDRIDGINTYKMRDNVFETCKSLNVEIHASYDLFMVKGSLYNTYNFISAVFNNVSTIYRNEGIYTSISRIVVNTSQASDAYGNLTTSLAKLNKLGENVKNSYRTFGGDMVHLMDHDSQGGGGIAWVNTLCYDYTYFQSLQYHYGPYAFSNINGNAGALPGSFPNYSLPVFMFAHEMGHTLGSNHTQWCGWSGGPIDNCATPESFGGQSCSSGPAPVNGGTIMSYCHNTSYGINFSQGFGPQPGAIVRSSAASASCSGTYSPEDVMAATPNQTMYANRECTDASGWTNYYNDQNTSDENDDIWLLSVKKNGENIGNLDDGSMSVAVRTSSNAGSQSTLISNPGYNATNDWYVMNRWFELIPTREPNSPVYVRFPYTNRDFQDVMVNQPMVKSHTDLTFYKIDNPGDPNPDHGHTSVGNNQITFYTHGASASLSTWKHSVNGAGANVAEFQVSSFSGGGGGFTEGDISSLILPVELLSFQVVKQDAHVLNKWSTATEVDNDFFTIERSINGTDYKEIGKVKGKGYASEIENYEFIDREPESGINYYRLSQTDFNGRSEILGIRTVNFEANNRYQVYPNPVDNNFVTIGMKSKKNHDIQIKLFDLTGRIIKNVNLKDINSNPTYRLDIKELNAGMYILEINQGSEKYIEKLIVE